MIAANLNTPDGDSVVRVSRTLSAAPATVFDAWVNQAKLQRWWAGEERVVRIHDLDARVGGAWRISSPPGRSILITSAPCSASWKVPNGPAKTCVKSSTRTPAKGLVTWLSSCR